MLIDDAPEGGEELIDSLIVDEPEESSDDDVEELLEEAQPEEEAEPEAQPEEDAEEVPEDETEEESEEDEEETEDDEEAEEDPVYTVKIDGKEEQVTLQEALDGYQRQADYQRKTADVAEERREVETERGQLEQDRETLTNERQQVLNIAGVLQQFLPQEPDWVRLYNEVSTEEYEGYKRWWADTSTKLNQAFQGVNEIQETVQQETEQDKNARLAKEWETVQDKIPELADPDPAKRLAAQRSIVDGAVEHYGFTIEEIQEFKDPRAYLLISDALKFKAQPDPKKIVEKKVKGKPPVTAKPGAKKPKPSKKDSAALLKKTRQGSQDAAVDYLTL